MFGRRRSSSRRNTQPERMRDGGSGKGRREGARWKIGEANKWGVTEGSTRLKINMIRQKTGDRLMEGNNRVEGVGKWRQVQGEEDRKTVRGRQTRRMGEGGESKPLTLVAVCGLLATVSAMHLFLSYRICTKQDVSLVIPESDRQYISCVWGQLLTFIAYWASLPKCYTEYYIDESESVFKIGTLTITIKGLNKCF